MRDLGTDRPVHVSVDAYLRIFELVRAGVLDLTAITPRTYALADLPAAMAAAAQVDSLACVAVTP